MARLLPRHAVERFAKSLGDEYLAKSGGRLCRLDDFAALVKSTFGCMTHIRWAERCKTPDSYRYAGWNLAKAKFRIGQVFTLMSNRMAGRINLTLYLWKLGDREYHSHRLC